MRGVMGWSAQSGALAWGTSARRERRSNSPMVLVSMPSITMRPPQGSTAQTEGGRQWAALLPLSRLTG